MIKSGFFLFLYCVSVQVFAQNHGTGLLLDEALYNTVPRTADLAKRSYENLPAYHNLQQYGPIPGDQGQTGTCTAWAIAYAARTIMESVGKGRTSVSETTENVFSPSFIYNQIRMDNTCSRGTYIHEGLELLKNQGVSKMQNFGFDCLRMPGPAERENADRYKIYDYKRLFNYDTSNKILPIKKSIASNNPVVFGMKCPDSFFSASDVWNVNEEEYTNPHSGGHAVVVIGYDDTKYGGAFLIQNSWGTNWGNKGYTWIRYNDFVKFTFEAYELIPEPAPKVDLSGSIAFLTEDGSTMGAILENGSYRMTSAYSSGTLFRFFITNEEPAWVYAIGTDSTGKIFRIFPHSDGVSPFISTSRSTIAFPDESHYVKMDNTIGEDIFCVIYSKERIDIESIIKQLEEGKGTFEANLQSVLGTKILLQDHIDFSGDEIRFSARSGDRTLIPIIVKIKHI